nr:MAG TPA: hypothetical protein [Caudoviricetes sp.]
MKRRFQCFIAVFTPCGVEFCGGYIFRIEEYSDG